MFIAVATARPDIGIQLQQHIQGGYAADSSDIHGGGSAGGSFGGVSEGLIKGETKVIDISSGGSSSSNVVYKPVIKQGPVRVTNHFFIHQSPEDQLTVEEREKEIEARRHKHYNILFIKASAGGSASFGGNAAIFPQVKPNFFFSKNPL